MRRWNIRCALWLCSAVVIAGVPSAALAALPPGDLVVADSQAFGGCGGGCGGLIAVNPNTGAETELSANSMPINASSQLMDAPFTLFFGANGNIVVGETSGLGGSCQGGCGGIVKVDPATGAETLVSSNAMPINAASQYFGQVNGVTVDRAGNIIVSDWGACVGCGKVISVDPTTGKETLVSSNAMPVNADSKFFQYPQGLAIGLNGEIYVADALAFGGVFGGIIAVNPSTGKESELSANSMAINASSQDFVGGPTGIAVDAAGDLLVTDWGGAHCCGKIVEVDPANGKESVFSSNAMPVNALTQYFGQPVGITIASGGDKIYVADEHTFGPCSPGCGGVIEVNPTTGAETEISANTLSINASDQLFVDPWSVALPGSSGGATLGGPTGSTGSTGTRGTTGATGTPGVEPTQRFRIAGLTVQTRPHATTVSAVFTAIGARGHVTYFCRLDRHRSRACTSPKSYKDLHPGPHTFSVRAIELRGADRTPWATRRFEIVA